MVSPKFILESRLEDEFYLEKLHYWLKWGSKSASMVLVLYWIPYGMFLMVIRVLAVLFTPYLITRLVQAGRLRSVAVFCGVVLLPAVAAQVIGPTAGMAGVSLSIFPIVAFYFFLWIQTSQIGEYLALQAAQRLGEYNRAVAKLTG
jgi:hypothetical protein